MVNMIAPSPSPTMITPARHTISATLLGAARDLSHPLLITRALLLGLILGAVSSSMIGLATVHVLMVSGLVPGTSMLVTVLGGTGEGAMCGMLIGLFVVTATPEQ